MLSRDSINRLNKTLSKWDCRYSVYDYDGYQIDEVLMQFFQRINEIIDSQNEVVKMVIALKEWIESEGLYDAVNKKLNEMVASGEMASIINEELFQSLNADIQAYKDAINETVAEIDSKKQDKIANVRYAKREEIISPLDDKTYIQGLIDDLNNIGGGILYICGETYDFGNSGIIIKDNVRLVGLGTSKFNSNATRDGHCIVGMRSNTSLENMIVELNLDNNGSTLGSRCIDVNSDGVLGGIHNVLIQNNIVRNGFYNIDIRDNSNTKYNTHIRIYNNKCYAPPVTNCGNIIWRYADDIICSGNYVEGGTTSSAIGSTRNSRNVKIIENTVRKCGEASIQLEWFPETSTLEHDSIMNCEIANNNCDGSIWIDDVSNISLCNNISDSIQITSQQKAMKNITISNEITGCLYAHEVYTPLAVAEIDNLSINNVKIIGSKYLWDNHAITPNYGLYCSSLCRNVLIDNIQVFGTFNNCDIGLTLSNEKSHYLIGNTMVNKVCTLGAENGTFKYMCNPIFSKYTKENLPSTDKIGYTVYNSTDKSLAVYTGGTDGYKSLMTEPIMYKCTTEGRPKDLLTIGYCCFDTTLGKPIWLKAKNVWVDATGTTV